jgi:NACHT domain
LTAYYRTTQPRDPLALLPYAPNASFNFSGKEAGPYCLEDTRVDILNQIRKWIDGGDDRHIFWLSGWAGTGKSTIARTVARELYNRKRPVASYFFSRGGGDIGNATKFVSTIARQLADKLPKFKIILQETVSQDEGIIYRVLGDQWRELITTPLSKLGADSTPSPLIVVVDALDECDTEISIRQVLQLLADTEDLDRRYVRILITSRPDIPIRGSFLQLSDSKYQGFVLHDISNDVVDDDIRRFLEHNLRDIRPKKEDVTQLVKNAAGLFIWAATACRFIGNGLSAKTRLHIILGSSTSTLTPNEYVHGVYLVFLQEAIKGLLWKTSVLYFWVAIVCGFVREGLFFKQWLYAFLMSNTVAPEGHLDWIYLTVLNRSLDSDSDSDSIAPTPQEIRHCSNTMRDVLGSIVVLFSLLSVKSVCRLLLISEEKEEEEAKGTLRSLHAILDIPKNETYVLRLHHPSFRDFLLNKRRCYDTYFWVDEKRTHQKLADRCIRLMSSSLKQNICEVNAPGILATRIESRQVEQYLLPELQYACRYWIQHLQKSGAQLRDGDQVHHFLQEHLLHWLEALAWVGKVSEGIHAVIVLESITAVSRLHHNGYMLLIRGLGAQMSPTIRIYSRRETICPVQPANN